jgi:hypothetical protein
MTRHKRKRWVGACLLGAALGATGCSMDITGPPAACCQSGTRGPCATAALEADQRLTPSSATAAEAARYPAPAESGPTVMASITPVPAAVVNVDAVTKKKPSPPPLVPAPVKPAEVAKASDGGRTFPAVKASDQAVKAPEPVAPRPVMKAPEPVASSEVVKAPEPVAPRAVAECSAVPCPVVKAPEPVTPGPVTPCAATVCALTPCPPPTPSDQRLVVISKPSRKKKRLAAASRPVLTFDPSAPESAAWSAGFHPDAAVGHAEGVRKGYVDLTVQPWFGCAEDHSWLNGQLMYSRATDTWRLHYASVDDADPYGGTVTLVGHEELKGLKDGGYVKVYGSPADPDRREPYSPYHVVSFEVVERPN